MIPLLLGVVAIGLTILACYHLKRHFGLALLYVFVGATQFLQNLLASTVVFDIPGYRITPGSAVFFAGSLMAILLVYLKEDIPATRKLIAAIVGANLVLAAIQGGLKLGLGQGYLSADPAIYAWIDAYEAHVYLVGTAILLADALVLAIIYEALRKARLAMPLRIIGALLLTLLFDSLLFIGYTLGGHPDFGVLLAGDLQGKALAAFLYGSMMSGYLALAGRRSDQVVDEPADVFSILSYRERYRALKAEKLEQERRARQALMHSERRYRDLFEKAPEMYIITQERDGEVVVSDCNESFLRRLGRGRPEVIGQPVSSFYAEEESTEYESTAGGHPIVAERRIVTRSGEIVETLVRAEPELDARGSVVGIRAVYTDITALKQVERELRDSRRRLRRLGARLEAVREEERTRLARNIHDELSQELTALSVDLAWALQDLPQDGEPSERLRAASTRIQELQESARNLASRLRPPVLDDFGLKQAILWYVNDFAERTGHQVDTDLDAAELDLAAERDIAIFRVLQEAFANIARHAGADRIRVALRIAGEQVELTVQDNGRGIREQDLLSPTSFGIIGMRERAEVLGGSLAVSRRPEGGTEVTLSVPLSATASVEVES